jgi:hypothetical protein
VRLDNATDFTAGYTQGMRPDGRELLVVVAKGTFTLPKSGGTPQWAEEQVPLVYADTFTGEPGHSAPVHESDFAPFKPRCDVILNGSAYAPGRKVTEKVPVTLQFGGMTKSFLVRGDRVWQNGLLSYKPGPERPFAVKPISYDNAFGGVDTHPKDPKKIAAVVENPVGKGFRKYLIDDHVKGVPLPNTEELKHPVTEPDGTYRPMAFGPVGRGWQPRAKLAGTYDQKWLDEVFPFLPADFQDAYHQCAAADQQVDYPVGGEIVGLRNLTPEGKIGFRFPKIALRVWFFLKNGEEIEQEAPVDTVCLEPDLGRFTVTCRTALPLRRNLFEVEFAVLGRDPEDLKRVIPEEEPFPTLGIFGEDEEEAEDAPDDLSETGDGE